nr:unnamed protein product [Callosobruchus chinensis]
MVFKILYRRKVLDIRQK